MPSISSVDDLSHIVPQGSDLGEIVGEQTGQSLAIASTFGSLQLSFERENCRQVVVSAGSTGGGRRHGMHCLTHECAGVCQVRAE